MAPTAGVVHVPATLPPVNVAETKVGPVGRTSFNTTFCAVAGPSLTIPIWYDRFEPAGTGSGLSVLVIDRSALELMAVLAVALLLAGVGSLVALDYRGGVGDAAGAARGHRQDDVVVGALAVGQCGKGAIEGAAGGAHRRRRARACNAATGERRRDEGRPGRQDVVQHHVLRRRRTVVDDPDLVRQVRTRRHRVRTVGLGDRQIGVGVDGGARRGAVVGRCRIVGRARLPWRCWRCCRCCPRAPPG